MLLRLRSLLMRRRTVQGAVGSMLVVERFELAQGMQEMSLIPDRRQVCTHLSMIEF
jgi:hypothetical protein